jgi:hypothetical protein
MCHAFVWSFDAITGLPWLELIKAAAPVATAFIAFLALKNWKRQDRANRQANFLDQLTEAVHTFIAEMSKPVTVAEFIKVSMDSHAPTGEGGDQSIKGIIAYIEKHGENDSKRLLEALDAVQPSTIRLRSLIAKGQVFRFKGYAKCYNAVVMLTWQFDRLEALMAFIRSPSVNWEHPAVSSLLPKMKIDTDEVHKSLMENNVAIIEFITAIYGHMYD